MKAYAWVGFPSKMLSSPSSLQKLTNYSRYNYRCRNAYFAISVSVETEYFSESKDWLDNNLSYI